MREPEKIHNKENILDEMKQRKLLSPELTRERTSSINELKEEIGEIKFKQLISTRIACLEQTKELFRNCVEDRIRGGDLGNTKLITFNGRFHPYQGVIEACEELGIEYILHERGTQKNTWRISKNTIPFDVKSLSEWIDKILINTIERRVKR